LYGKRLNVELELCQQISKLADKVLEVRVSQAVASHPRFPKWCLAPSLHQSLLTVHWIFLDFSVQLLCSNPACPTHASDGVGLPILLDVDMHSIVTSVPREAQACLREG
jgi:hypothetical protein